MFKSIQILSIIALIILTFLYNKKKKKFNNIVMITSAVFLIATGYISNEVLETIPLTTEVVTITAMGEKNEYALADEVKLLNLNIAGVKHENITPIDGKWMLDDKTYYLWRNENDTRQPDGLTRQIKIEVPVGLERLLTFRSDELSGLVKVEFEGETQIVDLYSQDITTKHIEITANSSSQMQTLKISRLIYWYCFITIIFCISAVIIYYYKKSPTLTPLIVIIVLQLLLTTYFCYEKEGYHVDEIWTNDLSNKFYEKYNTVTLNKWVDSDYYYERLTASEDNLFNYDAVYYNLSNDNHPPLYFYIYHTISSLYPNQLSKWIGFSINAFFNALSLILLFKICGYVFDNKIYSYLVLVLFGLSSANFNMAIFFRSYVLLAFLGLFFIYVFLKYIHEKEIDNTAIFYTILSTYLAFMTHYYFAIFAFFFTFIVSAIFFIRQEYKKMFKYGLSVTAAVGLVFITFPASYKYIFEIGRGAEALNNAQDTSDFIPNLNSLVNIILTHIFADTFGKIIFTTLIFHFIWILFNKFICRIDIKHTNNNKSIRIKCNWWHNDDIYISFTNSDFIIGVLFITAISYILVMALIAPYFNIRYLYISMPLICVVTVYLIKKFISYFNFDNTVNQGVLCAMITSILVVQFQDISLQNSYVYQQYIANYVQENQNLNCVTINKTKTSFTQYDDLLMQFDSTVTVLDSNISELASLIEEKDDIDKLILFILQDENSSKVLNEAMKTMNYTEYEKLYTYRNSTLYRLSGHVDD